MTSRALIRERSQCWVFSPWLWLWLWLWPWPAGSACSSCWRPHRKQAAPPRRARPARPACPGRPPHPGRPARPACPGRPPHPGRPARPACPGRPPHPGRPARPACPAGHPIQAARAPGPPSSSWSTSTDQPSPAVISLLAGRLDKDGYAATLLDLAARGWLRLTRGQRPCDVRRHPGRARAPGRNGLTAYERRAFAHAVLRAGGQHQFPAAALADGFPGHPNTAPACRRRVTA